MIHQYKLGGYNIVLDICSGSVHVVDDIAYDIIAMYENHDKSAILLSMAEKYPNQTEEALGECFDQITELIPSSR